MLFEGMLHPIVVGFNKGVLLHVGSPSFESDSFRVAGSPSSDYAMSFVAD